MHRFLFIRSFSFSFPSHSSHSSSFPIRSTFPPIPFSPSVLLLPSIPSSPYIPSLPSPLTPRSLPTQTKWSGRDAGRDGAVPLADAIKGSLEKLQLDAVDLYLIHSPRIVQGRIRESWRDMVKLHKQGYARSIGVSNYTLQDMKELLEQAEKGPEIPPAVNQIELHPYVWQQQKALVEYCQAKVRLRRLLVFQNLLTC